jgi:hypothetical protein
MDTFNFRINVVHIYVETPKSKMKVAFGKVFMSGVNVIVHGVPLPHDQVRIIVDDVVEARSHFIA